MAGCVTPPMEYQKNGWVSTEDWNAYIKDLVDVNLGFTTGPLLTVKGEVAFSTEVDITASTTQSQGQGALTKTYNEISVCAHADDVVTMPSAVAGKYVYIANNGAENLQIFPASGDNFQDEVTDASLTLANGGKFIAWAEDDTIWQYDQGTNPAGSNTQIQYNNSGMFGADSGLTWSGTFLTTSGIIRWGAGVGELTYNGTTAIVRAGAGKLLQFGPAAGTHYPLVMQVDGSMDIGTYPIGYNGSSGGLSFDAAHRAYLSHGLTIGTGAAGIDYDITFNGEDADASIVFQEDEDNIRIGGASVSTLGDMSIPGNLTVGGSVNVGSYPNIVCNDNQVVCHNNEVVTT